MDCERFLPFVCIAFSLHMLCPLLVCLVGVVPFRVVFPHIHTHLMIHLFFFETSVSPAEGTRKIKCVRQRYTCAIISVREQCDQYLFDSKRFYYQRRFVQLTVHYK